MAQETQKTTTGAQRFAVWLAGIVLALFVLLVLVRVFIRPIPPGQVAPAGHFGDPCWACHLVTASADPAELP